MDLIIIIIIMIMILHVSTPALLFSMESSCISASTVNQTVSVITPCTQVYDPFFSLP